MLLFMGCFLILNAGTEQTHPGGHWLSQGEAGLSLQAQSSGQRGNRAEERGMAGQCTPTASEITAK